MLMEQERVQGIAFRTGDTIPEAFIRSEHERPALTTVHGFDIGVPTIDVSNPDQEKVDGLIIEASKEWGMFQIINHGIDSETINKFQSVGKEFFELPQEEKEKYAKKAGGKEGYGTLLQRELEGKKAWVDHFFHKIWPPSAINYQFWPKIPSYREANEEYAEQLLPVADRLFRTLSMGLGLEENEIKKTLGGEKLEYLLKINYYPPCPRPDLALGVVAHSDMSSITLLVPNQVPGLQACRNGKWYDVNYVSNAIVILIGDQLQVLSNGKYTSVLHRATVNKEMTRMSWPVFLEPPEELEVGPHPRLVNAENPAKYKTKKFGDYCYCKYNKIPQ